MKQLPKLYTNTFNKKIDNSKDFIKITENNYQNKLSKYEINQKINKIFKSNTYIYKIKTKIKTINGNRTETIIGKTNNNLITIDNELINISDILDIKKEN